VNTRVAYETNYKETLGKRHTALQASQALNLIPGVKLKIH